MLTWLVRQFGHPTGSFRALAGFIMANRPSNRRRNEWAVSLVQPEMASSILEIGCGPGLALEAICRTHSGARVVGIDHSTVMVAQARRRVASCVGCDTTRAQVRQAEATQLPFADFAFDRVFAVNSFAFWRTRPGGIGEVFRVLKPAGRFIVVHQPRNRGATDETTRRFAATTVEELLRAGFTNVQTRYLRLSPLVVGILADRPSGQAVHR